MRWDHPRLRGEQRADTRTVYCSPGSPPLARGTGFLRAPTKSGTGITPACAGNSKHVVCDARQLWDHPRLRGEQIDVIDAYYLIWGSPPLARGTACAAIPRHGRARITPACAGNSISSTAVPSAARDHPRLRGEQKTPSGPLVPAPWITPACAGNSAVRLLPSPLAWDHPRLRGEQADYYGMIYNLSGSPPLARGTAVFAVPALIAFRITPACAGNRNPTSRQAP